MKKLLIVLFFVCTMQLSAQFTDEYYLSDIVPPSPEAASLGKYAEQPVDLFHGRVKVEIPLFTIESGRISVPISLSYHGSGVKLEEIASRVGLGWTLNAGGVVTRSVVGLSDALYHSKECPDGDYSQDLCEAMGYLVDDGISYERITYLDQGPDKYYFNFPGGSGGFYFGKDLSIKKTSFNNMKIEPTIPSLDPIDFKITDDQGIEYFFEETEMTYQFNVDLPLDLIGMAYESSWYLSKIYDPVTDRSVQFNYRDLGNIEMDEYKSETFTPGGDVFCNSIFGISSGSDNKSRQQSTISGAKVIESIVYDYGKIEFSADLSRQDFVGDRAITSIAQYDQDHSLIAKYDLNYSHVSNGGTTDKHKRLVLNTIQQVGSDTKTGIPPYRFSYDNIDQLPERESFEKDIWGYYNANGATTLEPKMWIYEGAGKATYLPIRRNAGVESAMVSGTDRNCNTTTVKYGSLTRITYPTLGYVEYEYEPHVFFHREAGVFQSAQEFTGGGIRIAKVRHYSAEGTLAKTTTYDYQKGFTSGTIPQAGIPTEVVTDGVYDDVMLRYDRNSAPLGSNDGTFVGYEIVTVKNEDTNGNTIGNTEFWYNTVQNELPTYETDGSCIDMVNHLLENSYWPYHDVIDRSPLMGKLIYQRVENEEGDVLKETNYVYRDEFKNENSIIRFLGSTVQDGSSYAVTSTRTTSEQVSLLEEEKVTLYDVDDEFETTSYTYDPATYYLKEESITSGGITEIISYYYPADFRGNSVCDKMISMNYLSPQVAIHKYREISGSNYLIGSKVFEFKNYNGATKILPFKLYEAEVESPIASTPSISYGANPPSGIYYPYHEFTEYGSHGNLKQVYSETTGMITSYYWDEDELYLLFKAENATYTELNNAVINEQDENEGIRELLPEAFISSFSYKPLVGVISQTDPNGTTTYYEYDEFNRLNLTRDHNGNVVQHYEYNYGYEDGLN